MATEQDPVQAQREQKEREQEKAFAQNAAAVDDAQKDMVEEAENAGVTAFTFDPDASMEEKRAQARAVSCPEPRPSCSLPQPPLLTRSRPSRPYRQTFNEPMASRSPRTRPIAANPLSTSRPRRRPAC